MTAQSVVLTCLLTVLRILLLVGIASVLAYACSGYFQQGEYVRDALFR